MEHFTPRELEVLKLICEGHSTRRVATKFGIAFKTAASHRHSILAKVGVHNAVGLLRWAIKHGYVEVELPAEWHRTDTAKPHS